MVGLLLGAVAVSPAVVRASLRRRRRLRVVFVVQGRVGGRVRLRGWSLTAVGDVRVGAEWRQAVPVGVPVVLRVSVAVVEAVPEQRGTRVGVGRLVLIPAVGVQQAVQAVRVAVGGVVQGGINA